MTSAGECRKRCPSIKLVHVETMGADGSKTEKAKHLGRQNAKVCRPALLHCRTHTLVADSVRVAGITGEV